MVAALTLGLFGWAAPGCVEKGEILPLESAPPFDLHFAGCVEEF
jgi:hypothetical protein